MTTRLTATLALCTALVAGMALAEDNSELQLMFVQTAAGIEIDRAAQELRLKDVVPQVLYFSDRPQRVAGHVDMAGYLEEWTKGKDNFGEDPPNATLSVYEPVQSENTTVVIEIMQPEVDGKDITYRYTLINGEMPAAGENAALFIDWIGPGGGVGAGIHGIGVGARGPGVAGWPVLQWQLTAPMVFADPRSEADTCQSRLITGSRASSECGAGRMRTHLSLLISLAVRQPIVDASR